MFSLHPPSDMPGALIPAAVSRRCQRPLLLALTLLVSACAGARLQPGVLRMDLGHGSLYEIDRAVQDLVHQAGYSILTVRPNPSGIYYETLWRTRGPHRDERGSGADRYRTRIILEATQGRAHVYHLRMRAETDARSGTTGAWSSVAVPETLREQITGLADAIHLRIDAGVRVY